MVESTPHSYKDYHWSKPNKYSSSAQSPISTAPNPHPPTDWDYHWLEPISHQNPSAISSPETTSYLDEQWLEPISYQNPSAVSATISSPETTSYSGDQWLEPISYQNQSAISASETISYSGDHWLRPISNPTTSAPTTMKQELTSYSDEHETYVEMDANIQYLLQIFQLFGIVPPASLLQHSGESQSVSINVSESTTEMMNSTVSVNPLKLINCLLANEMMNGNTAKTTLQ